MSRKYARSAYFADGCILLVLLAWILAGSGCLSREARIPPSPPVTVRAWEPPASVGPQETAAPPAAETPAADEAPAAKAAPAAEEPPAAKEPPAAGEAPPAAPAEGAQQAAGEPPAAGPEAAEPAAPVPPKEPPSSHMAESREPERHATEPPAGVPKSAAPHAPGQAAAPKHSLQALSGGEPAWAAGKEVLVYRIGFLGMTVGYARFTYMGKATLRGKEVYRLNVQAWTTGLLTLIYKGDTIDYYLDARTLAPLQQEFTNRGQQRDDVAVYDQETGRIVYRYKDTGEIRKQVEAIPNVYDPVSVAYYFRARDLGAAERPRQVYAGRKLWQISSRLVGHETIDTYGGPVDTVVIQPVIKREGKVENKGDLRMWMSNDARHVPVRLYAKFKKIKEWTLVAELLPPREGS